MEDAEEIIMMFIFDKLVIATGNAGKYEEFKRIIRSCSLIDDDDSAVLVRLTVGNSEIPPYFILDNLIFLMP